MKTMNYKISLLSLMLLFSWAIAMAQQGDSLVSYLEIAAKNNPLVQQKFYEYKAALEKVPQVGSLPDPDLNVGVFLSPMELISGNQVADIRLMQMFPWFGVLKNAKDEMSLMAKAKFELFRESKLQVLYDVQRTWFDLYKTQKNIKNTEKNIAILHTLEKLSLVKYKTGSITGSSSSYKPSSNNVESSTPSSGMQTMGGGNSGVATTNQSNSASNGNAMNTSASGTSLADLYRIQIEIENLNNKVESLKNEQKTTIARFNAFLNRIPSSVIAVPDTLEILLLNKSLQSIADSIQSNNPMLGMLQYEQQSLEARKRMVDKMGYPMVGIGVNYTVINKSEMSTSAMNGKDMIMPMITVTLPIYRKKYNAMVEEAGLLKSASEQNYKYVANSVQTEYYEAIQAYDDASRRMKLYEGQTLLINKSLNIMLKTYTSSNTGLSDLLIIQQQNLDYEFKQVEALVDYNKSIALLKKLGCLN